MEWIRDAFDWFMLISFVFLVLGLIGGRASD